MDLYKRILRHTPEKKANAYISLLFSSISAFLSVLPFLFLWRFLEALIEKEDLSAASDYAVLIILLMLGYSLFYFLSLWASHILAFRLESNLRKEGTRHLMNASFSFFDQNQSGRIRKIIDDNAAQTHMIVAHLIPDICIAVLTPIFLLSMIFAIDYRMGILLIILFILGLLQMKMMMGGQEFMKTYYDALDRMNAETVEYVRGMQVVKIFRSTLSSFKVFYGMIMEYSKNALDYSMSCRRPYVIFQIIYNIVVAFSIPFAVVLINGGESKASILAKTVFFAAYAGILFVTFMKIMYVGMYYFLADQSIGKLETIYEEMECKKLSHGKEEHFENYDIEFEHVSFKYDQEFILKDFCLKLEENKTYAFVGSSGGGKSTIAKLISGFYAIEEGRILIGGKGIDEYSEEALMKNIAFVFQNTKLFKTSIYENVKLGREDASEEEVMEALRLARCEDILDKLPQREHTMIGAKGVHLSGGEIQRIAIARAILKNAKIIILDEASAAADPENEYEIQRAFSNLMKEKTVIMIAHRLSSIRKVDEIIVIEEGKVLERGSDAELMAKGGKYRDFQEMFSKANDWRVYDQQN
ncbi:MAG: ABC transporter ATP-binding protein [Johnsonella sp.]|nr:ABC transporter ATP-binding protein [Johnsonella sp.]